MYTEYTQEGFIYKCPIEGNQVEYREGNYGFVYTLTTPTGINVTLTPAEARGIYGAVQINYRRSNLSDNLESLLEEACIMTDEMDSLSEEQEEKLVNKALPLYCMKLDKGADWWEAAKDALGEAFEELGLLDALLG